MHIHTYIYTQLHTYRHTYINAYIHRCTHTYMHTCIHTHTHLHTYRYTCTQTYNFNTHQTHNTLSFHSIPTSHLHIGTFENQNPAVKERRWKMRTGRRRKRPWGVMSIFRFNARGLPMHRAVQIMARRGMAGRTRSMAGLKYVFKARPANTGRITTWTILRKVGSVGGAVSVVGLERCRTSSRITYHSTSLIYFILVCFNLSHSLFSPKPRKMKRAKY